MYTRPCGFAEIFSRSDSRMTLKESRKKIVETEAKKAALSVAKHGFCHMKKSDREIRVAQDIDECLAKKYGIVCQEDDQGDLIYFYKGTNYEEAEKRRVESCAKELAQDVIVEGYVIAKPKKRSHFSHQVNAVLESKFNISSCKYDDGYYIYFLSSSDPERIKKRANAAIKGANDDILRIVLRLEGSEKGEDRLLMKLLEMLSSEKH